MALLCLINEQLNVFSFRDPALITSSIGKEGLITWAVVTWNSDNFIYTWRHFHYTKFHFHVYSVTVRGLFMIAQVLSLCCDSIAIQCYLICKERSHHQILYCDWPSTCCMWPFYLTDLKCSKFMSYYHKINFIFPYTIAALITSLVGVYHLSCLSSHT